MKNYAIIGSGMAGFGAAYRMNSEGIMPTIYEKNQYHGGHTASFRYDSGFLFDIGPHISFTKDSRIQQLFAESVHNNYEIVQIHLNNYWRGYWPQHPVQLHLHGLPEDIIVKVINDFVEESYAPEREIKNYADWLLSSFGKSFAELFPMKYTRKYHLTEAENMTTDWLGPRIYRPNLEEIIRGAVSEPKPRVHTRTADKHYITTFRYPSEGGFVAYLNKFVPMANIKLNHELISIDPKNRTLKFSNGLIAKYDSIISSVPLPELIRIIPNVPNDVVNASNQLACSTCVLVNVGVNRDDISNADVTYFYDEDITFTRLSFPHMFSKQNAPPGAGSIQAEVYFSKKYKPLKGSKDDWIEPVIKDLKRCGYLRDSDKILFKNAILVPYANIIFDFDRTKALKIVHEYLDEMNIAYCGRYGGWGYLWTDESFKSGENAAEKVMNGIKT